MYRVGGTGNATDVNQIIDAATGQNDVGAFQLFAQLQPPGALIAAVNSTSGNLTGSYQYKVAFVTGYWQGPIGAGALHTQGNTGGGASSGTISPAAQQVNLSAIPIGAPGVVARVIYRTKANGSTFYFLQQINDNTTTTWIDNVADANLGAAVPTTNTTGSYFAGDGRGLTNLPLATNIAPGVIKGSTSVQIAQDGTASVTPESIGAATDATNIFTGTQTAPEFVATSQVAPLQLPNLSASPGAVGPAGTVCIVNGQWYMSDGAHWNQMAPTLPGDMAKLDVAQTWTAAQTFGTVYLGGQDNVSSPKNPILLAPPNATALGMDANGNLLPIDPTAIQAGNAWSVYGKSGNTDFSVAVDGTHKVNTFNNILDDGSGNTTIAGTLTVGGKKIGPLASVSDVQLASTNATAVTSYTPALQRNFSAKVYVRVVTAATNVTITVTYTSGSGSQTYTMLPTTSLAIGDHSFPAFFFNATISSAIQINVTAGTASQVYASATIVGE